MRKTFKKYFTSLVFVLLSGFLLFQANATSGSASHVLHATVCKTALPAAIESHFSPIFGGFNASMGRFFVEETEFEDLDHSADSDNFNPHFFHSSIAIFFQFLEMEHRLQNNAGLSAYQIPVLDHCRKHIRFGIFRI